MLCCYFIARSDAGIENLAYRTLNAEPLHFVQQGELVAAVRPLPPGTRLTPELMLEYNGVLAAASRRATVLPLRFGAHFRSENEVVRLLAARGQELLAALERLEGKVEIGLRMRLRAGESAQAAAARITGVCEPLDSRLEVRSDAAGETVLELAHLINRQDAAAYRERLKSHAVEVTGPWPPFHFLPQFLRLPVKAERRTGRARSASAESAG